MENLGKQKLVIVGDGETAQLAYEYFTYDSRFEVAAFTVEQAFLKKNSLFGLPVVAFEQVQNQFSPQDYHMFVAVSYTELNRVRTKLYRQAKNKGYRLASYVSSRAFVWRNVEIGENCFILENNALQSNVKVGNNVTLWSGSFIGHRTHINDNCFLSGNVGIAGFCEIGENCFLGVNSCVAGAVKIAKDCIIGAGAVVIKDTYEGGVYVGNPAERLPNKTSFQSFNVKQEAATTVKEEITC